VMTGYRVVDARFATAARSRVSSANDSGKSKFARIVLESGRNGN
jgi:hypothetical protein